MGLSYIPVTVIIFREIYEFDFGKGLSKLKGTIGPWRMCALY